MRISTKLKILLACLTSSTVLTVFFGVYPLNPICDCNSCHLQRKQSVTERSLSWSDDGHKLCILVPFRDRLEELLEFAPHIRTFLNRQRVRHVIIVVNQVDEHRFNRASLINVGFLESHGQCDYIAMHDVDLLPLNDELRYDYPEAGPFHVSAPELHPRYHYKTFVGGILLLTREHFQKVNGLSNKYWGWGLEDDEFYLRLKSANLTVTRPSGITTNARGTFKHVHDQKRRRRDMARVYNQSQVNRRRDWTTGLNNVQYRLLNSHAIIIDSASVIMLNVQLACNKTLTPWCDNVPTTSEVKPKIKTAVKKTPNNKPKPK